MHNTLEEVREAIDALDYQLIELLSKRQNYVNVAARFKASAEQVKAPERQQTMMSQRRAWAEELDLSPEMIEKLFKDLIDYFVAHELHNWQNSRNEKE